MTWFYILAGLHVLGWIGFSIAIIYTIHMEEDITIGQFFTDISLTFILWYMFAFYALRQFIWWPLTNWIRKRLDPFNRKILFRKKK